ncbi:MAG: KpsF/GutQ family sugar-phosphate isomerase [Chlamydia sp.]
MLPQASLNTARIVTSLMETLSQELQIFFHLFDIASFSRLLDALMQKKGHFIFTGVGKSGFIARKIAATMSSSGTPSLFLSPQDALHGDLGVIGMNDSVFLISKSGETDELIELCPALRKKGAHLIAVVATQRASRLVKMCDDSFIIPSLRELCPFELAPTTSTLAQLIFGDLLAMTLMRKKEISRTDFIVNHPAGRIGKRHLFTVADLMVRGEAIPKCTENMLLTDVLVELSNKKCGCICVISEKNGLAGIFTDGDLRRVIQKYREKAFSYLIKDLMNCTPRKISPEILAYDAMLIMEEDTTKLISVLPVINGSSELIGLIRMHDIVQSGL